MTLQARTTIETYYSLTDKLRTNKRLFFTRFGDGEIFNMMGLNSGNHNFNSEMKKELTECFTIKHPHFLIASAINQKLEKGMSKGLFAPNKKNSDLENFILSNNLQNSSGIYENPVMFHYLMVYKPKLIIDFLNEFVRPKKKMFIGSTPQEQAEKLYGKIDIYINVPARFAYEKINEWWPDVEKNVDKVNLVIPSAGVSSNVVCKRLWELNKEIHLINIGSIIDAVEGKGTRKWIRLKGHKINKILPEEFREKNIFKKIGHVLKDIKFFLRSFIK